MPASSGAAIVTRQDKMIARDILCENEGIDFSDSFKQQLSVKLLHAHLGRVAAAPVPTGALTSNPLKYNQRKLTEIYAPISRGLTCSSAFRPARIRKRASIAAIRKQRCLTERHDSLTNV